MENVDDYIKGIDHLISLLNNNYHNFRVGSCSLWINTGWESQPFKRQDFEILYIISGEVEFTMGNSIHCGKAGDLFFIDNNLGNSCRGGNFVMYNIQFAFMPWISPTIREETAEIFSALSLGVNPGNTNLLDKTCRNISFDYSVKQDYYAVRAKCVFIDFLIQAIRAIQQKYNGKRPLAYNKYREKVMEIAQYLTENLEKKHCLSNLAKMAGLNERYFNLQFKSTTGYPVFQYIQHLKIDRAKRMLVTSRASITEIAFELGFDSSQYFCRIFKKITGLTPSGYKELVFSWES